MKSLREWLAIVGLAVTVMIVATKYWTLPETIATHFNASGVANGWGSKTTLWFIPVMACVLFTLLTLIRFIPERMMNMPVSQAQRAAALPMCFALLGWVKVELMWVLAAASWMIVGEAQGRNSSLMTTILMVNPVVILGTVVFYLWRMMKLPEA
jgi:uncharacterized membrane protein